MIATHDLHYEKSDGDSPIEARETSRRVHERGKRVCVVEFIDSSASLKDESNPNDITGSIYVTGFASGDLTC